jgi:hypothetical protein
MHNWSVQEYFWLDIFAMLVFMISVERREIKRPLLLYMTLEVFLAIPSKFP